MPSLAWEYIPKPATAVPTPRSILVVQMLDSPAEDGKEAEELLQQGGKGHSSWAVSCQVEAKDGRHGMRSEPSAHSPSHMEESTAWKEESRDVHGVSRVTWTCLRVPSPCSSSGRCKQAKQERDQPGHAYPG